MINLTFIISFLFCFSKVLDAFAIKPQVNDKQLYLFDGK